MCDSRASHSRESSVSVASSNDSGAGVVLSVTGLTRRGGCTSAKDSPRSEDSGQAGHDADQASCQQCGALRSSMGQASSTLTTPTEDVSSMVRLEPEGINEEDEGQDLASFLSVDKRLFGRLQEELTQAQSQLRLKEEQVVKLSRIRDDIEGEMEELTASLFQLTKWSRKPMSSVPRRRRHVRSQK